MSASISGKLSQGLVSNMERCIDVITLFCPLCRMFEIKATLPVEHQLRVQIMDWDLFTSDDLIGETVIDLEDRYLTKFRATCGLAKSYCV